MKKPKESPKFKRDLTITLQSNDFINLVNTQLELERILTRLQNRNTTKTHVWVSFIKETTINEKAKEVKRQWKQTNTTHRTTKWKNWTNQ